MPTFEPVDHDPFADFDPNMPPEAYADPRLQKVFTGTVQGAVEQKALPGAAMQPNPYPEGSEEAAWYDNDRQDKIAAWGPGMAMAQMGTGLVVPAKGSGPAFGSGLINWDRETVSHGNLPIYGDKTVIDVPVSALDRAFKATDSRMYVDKPKPEVAEYAASGKPMSVPEVDAPNGRIGFTNGRNRFAVARDNGETTIPVATETPDELRALLAKHGDAPPQPGITAYHGSPHDFDRFSLDKIGTGEGAQAYGHGLYFAENEGVAKGYKNTLAEWKVNGAEPDPSNPSHIAAVTLKSHDGDIGKAVADLRTTAESKLPAEERAAAAKAIDMIQQGQRLPEASGGHMYQVNINADPEHFLDWDKPLSEQHPNVQAFARSLEDTKPPRELPSNFVQGAPHSSLAQPIADSLAKDPKWKGQWDEDRVWRHINEKYPDWTDASKQQIADEIQVTSGGKQGAAFSIPPTTTGQQLHDLAGNKLYVHPSKVGEKMAEAGIPGIKYLDQGSRAAGEGSRNYVVFNDKLIDIVKKYAVAGIALPPAVAAAMSQQFEPVDHDPFAQ